MVDWFVRAFGAAIEDVRHRLVEEPWYGKSTTTDRDPARSPSEQLGWDRAAPDHCPSAAEHDLDRGIDR